MQQTGDWCGVHLDLASKSVALTEKSLAKVARSWELRKSWTWRGFAAHIGLLFWAWGILDLPMPEFFGVLSFVSRVGQNLTKDESLWDDPAYIWDSVWPVLERWTNMLVSNTPRVVRPRTEPEWLVCTDASRYGWGYVALNESTGEFRHHGAPWSAHMEQNHGDKLGSSVFAEPHGVVNSIFHLFALNKPTRVKLGTDNTATQASFTRGFNSHSPAINDCIRRLRARFPLLDIDYVYVQGEQNPADYASRGGDVARKDPGQLSHSLRQVMGTGSTS